MSTKDRKAAEEFALRFLKTMTGSDLSSNFWKKRFETMSDAEFAALMDDFKNGRGSLVAVQPNFETGMSSKRNFALAEKLFGYKFEQQVIYGATDELPAFQAPIKSVIVTLPMRRMAQTVEKKRKLPTDPGVIDVFTGQPTGKSKGAKISYPELQYLAAMGLNKTAHEFISVRGGDNRAMAAMYAMIEKYGEVNLATIEHFATGVTSVKTLSVYLSGMHLANNLMER